MEEFRERNLLRLKLGLSDEYIFKQSDEGEDIIAENFLTGQRIFWHGQHWVEWN